MHIPDGYLSPLTCAVTYALALPFWVVAFRRVRRQLHTQAVPQLALFSAYSFVLMMFNLPLPGGTTGHAVGMGVAAIVLGPWMSIVAISIALLIQALFFGDGGITAFGANCLNMAIVGSWAAWGMYRLLAGRSPGARRRVIAAGLAGYVAINLSALLAAFEFGIQPLWFHDAAGTPLYAPYPLSIAVPAMMIGHLTFAGLAEMLTTAGLIGYLQRAYPEWLEPAANPVPGATTRRLWYWLAGLMILSPLGLLAAGTAWGEWSAEDFADPAGRAAMLQASGNALPPQAAPQGLARLASLWQAPLPDYAPSFLHSPVLGYLLSAVVGAGLILLVFLLLGRRRRARP